jgi:hypothetical protein
MAAIDLCGEVVSQKDGGGRDKPGHDGVSDSRVSNGVVMAARVAAIHVFLVFQRLSERAL